MFTRHLRRTFAHTSFSDPYKFLGVARSADFKTIKLEYLKLVRKHHPDLNQGDEESLKLFEKIKDSFEEIQYDRGIKKRLSSSRTFEDDGDDFVSNRPHSSQYHENYDEFKEKYGDFDYNEYRYRAAGDETFSRQSSSFEELHETNTRRFKINEGRLKNTLSRFDIDSVRAKLSFFSEGSSLVAPLFGCLFVVILILVRGDVDKKDKQLEQVESDKLALLNMRVNNLEVTREQVELSIKKNLDNPIASKIYAKIQNEGQTNDQQLLKLAFNVKEVFDSDSDELA